MGRWGDGIYESDVTQDYLGIIIRKMELELDFSLKELTAAPTQSQSHFLSHPSHWRSRILNIIEMMVLFEQHEFASSGYLDEDVIQSWREAFFKAWDGDWEYATDVYAHGQAAFRQKHRPAVVALFDRLQSVARYWASLANNTPEPALTPLLPEHPLPFFSIHRRKRTDNTEWLMVEGFTSNLIEHLVRDVIYYLSPEKRNAVDNLVIEQVWAAVDILALLSMAYQQSCKIAARFIRGWRTTTGELWGPMFEGEDPEFHDSISQEMVEAFDRLEAASLKYPPHEWESG